MADRKTRYFILAAVVVLVGGLCTGLVAYYRSEGVQGFTGVNGGIDDLRYVPDEASVIAFADVRTVMDSELRQRLAQKMGPQDERKRNRLRDETGIDIETDVDSAVAALLPGPGGETHASNGFAVLRGRFDTERVKGAATAHGATDEVYNGRQLIVMPDTRHEHGRAAFVFVEDGTLLIGGERAVKGALDRFDTGASGPTDATLLQLIDEARADDATTWAVARPDALRTRGLPEPVNAQITQINWLAASGRLNGGLDATLRAEAVDAEAAKNLREAVAGILALARLGAANHEQWQPAIQSVQIGGDGTLVTLSVALPLTVVDQIVGELPGRMPEPPPAPDDPSHPVPPGPPGAPEPPDPPGPPSPRG